MSQGISVDSVRAPVAAGSAPTVQAEAGEAPAKAVAIVDGTAAPVARIGMEKAKLSGLQAPASGVGVRGSSRVASDGDLWAGLLIGGLWASSLNR